MDGAKMKSNLFRKVINEEYIEVDKNLSETIEQLCELCGTVRESLPYDAEITFNCQEKGKLKVERHIHHLLSRHPENYFPLHKMYGQVISKDGKTYVQIISEYSRLNLCLQYLLLTICILFCPIYLLLRIPVRTFNLPFFIILALLCSVALICGYTPKSQQKKRNLVLLPTMREEIIKRIQKIERWSD